MNMKKLNFFKNELKELPDFIKLTTGNDLEKQKEISKRDFICKKLKIHTNEVQAKYEALVIIINFIEKGIDEVENFIDHSVEDILKKYGFQIFENKLNYV